MIQSFFEQIWRMAVGGTALMVCALLARPFLKSFPRNLTCVLWAVLALRLSLPFSIPVDLPAGLLNELPAAREMGDLFNGAQNGTFADQQGAEGGGAQSGTFADQQEAEGGSAQLTALPDGGGQSFARQAETGRREAAEQRDKDDGEKTARFAGGMQERTEGKAAESNLRRAAAFVWAAGAAAVLLYCIVMNVCLRRRVREAVLVGKQKSRVRVMECDRIETAFVLGIFRPTIYLPASLKNPDRRYVLIHERTHLRRRDHIWKWTACLFLSVYWFHPLMWICAFVFFKDVEEACDEAVMRKVGEKGKLPYAEALFHAAQETKIGWVGAPGFGEGNVKKRVKRVLEYRKKAAAGVAAAAAVMLAACSPFFMEGRETAAADTEQAGASADEWEEKGTAADKKTEAVEAGTSEKTEGEEKDGKTEKGYDAEYVAKHAWTVEPVAEEELTEPLMAADPYRVILRKNVGGFEDMDVIYTEPAAYDRVSDAYGIRIHPETQEEKLHSGVDLAAEAGTAVYAAAEGIAVETGFDDVCGNYVIIRHPNGELTYYANCEQILVQEGDSVDTKTQIASIGSTGQSTGPHLHFARSRNGVYVEPFENQNGFEESGRAHKSYRDSLTAGELEETGKIVKDYCNQMNWGSVLWIETAPDDLWQYQNGGIEAEYAPGNIIIYGVVAEIDGKPEDGMLKRTVSVARTDPEAKWRVINAGKPGYQKEPLLIIGDSERFERAEIEAAMAVVEKELESFDGALMGMWYDEKQSDERAEAYLLYGRGRASGASKDNTIVLLSDFIVKDSGGEASLNPEAVYTYPDFSWILIRDDSGGPWRVDDRGY